jgi:hypothetical protein
MGWTNTFLGSGVGSEASPVDACDETVINGAPYDAHKTIPSGAETAAAPGDRLDAPIGEEIERRLASLAVPAR